MQLNPKVEVQGKTPWCYRVFNVTISTKSGFGCTVLNRYICVQSRLCLSIAQVARRLKLRNLRQFESRSGGAAIERLARGADVTAFASPSLHAPINNRRDCNFSFSGVTSRYLRLIAAEEARHGVRGGNVLPNVADVCASLQYSMALHVTNKLNRALVFWDYDSELRKQRKALVSCGHIYFL